MNIKILLSVKIIKSNQKSLLVVLKKDSNDKMNL